MTGHGNRGREVGGPGATPSDAGARVPTVVIDEGRPVGSASKHQLEEKAREFQAALEEALAGARADLQVAQARVSQLEASLAATTTLLTEAGLSDGAGAQGLGDGTLMGSHPMPVPKPFYPSVRYPRGQRAVVAVLEDADGQMTREEILEGLEERGWPPRSADPPSAVGASIRRALKDGTIVERPMGRYQLSDSARVERFGDPLRSQVGGS